MLLKFIHYQCFTISVTNYILHLRGPCLGMVVDGGYMFLMDPDMSSFPCVTWHCPKYRWLFANTKIQKYTQIQVSQIIIYIKIQVNFHKFHINTHSLPFQSGQVSSIICDPDNQCGEGESNRANSKTKFKPFFLQKIIGLSFIFFFKK